MSITFDNDTFPSKLEIRHVGGCYGGMTCIIEDRCTLQEVGGPSLNVANANGRALLEWLEIPFDYCGKIKASELRAKIGRALMRGESHAAENSRPVQEEVGDRGARLIDGGLPAVRFKRYAATLIKVCEVDPEGEVSWS